MTEPWKWLEEIEKDSYRLDPAIHPFVHEWLSAEQAENLISVVRAMRDALDFYANGKSKMLLWHEDDLAVAKETLARCAEGKVE